jgi:predicted Rossmann fold nucleotide-binding protein DprA/Smf involved in DNA uptake
VPGPVGSRLSVGPNNLLASGACLVRDAQDVLDAMLGCGVRQPEGPGLQLSSTQRDVLRALEDGAQGEEEIASDAGISESEVEEVLKALEKLGYTAASQVTTYSATGLQPPPEFSRGAR